MDEKFEIAEETGAVEPIDIPDDVPVAGYAKYWRPGTAGGVAQTATIVSTGIGVLLGAAEATKKVF